MMTEQEKYKILRATLQETDQRAFVYLTEVLRRCDVRIYNEREVLDYLTDNGVPSVLVKYKVGDNLYQFIKQEDYLLGTTSFQQELHEQIEENNQFSYYALKAICFNDDATISKMGTACLNRLSSLYKKYQDELAGEGELQVGAMADILNVLEEILTEEFYLGLDIDNLYTALMCIDEIDEDQYYVDGQPVPKMTEKEFDHFATHWIEKVDDFIQKLLQFYNDYLAGKL